MLMSKNVNNDVSKDSPIKPLTCATEASNRPFQRSKEQSNKVTTLNYIFCESSFSYCSIVNIHGFDSHDDQVHLGNHMHSWL